MLLKHQQEERKWFFQKKTKPGNQINSYQGEKGLFSCAGGASLITSSRMNCKTSNLPSFFLQFCCSFLFLSSLKNTLFQRQKQTQGVDCIGMHNYAKQLRLL